MRKLLGLLIACGLCTSAFAQGVNLELGYTYIYAPQWDKALQTYNFARPFVSEKQALLQHGVFADWHAVFASQHTLKQGLGLSYSYFRSTAENPGLINTLNLHLAKPYYLIHFQKEAGKGLYSELTVAVLLGGMTRRVNEESYLIDGDRAMALGIGGELAYKAGYCIKLGASSAIAPFVQVGVAPFYYSPKTEQLLNQTMELTSNAATPIFQGRAGLALAW